MFLAYAPVFLWIALIFFLSSNSGSMEETSRFIGPLLQFLFPSASREILTAMHGYVRKAAHFTEYAILAFLAVRALSVQFRRLLAGWRYVIPLGLVALVASLDEYNQSLTMSRTGSTWDVLLDISGGAVMIAVMIAIQHRGKIRDQ